MHVQGDTRPSTGDSEQTTRTVSLIKITDLLGLNVVGNIWDNVSTLLNYNKIYNIGLIVFRHLNAEQLHVISLTVNNLVSNVNYAFN